MEVRQQGRMGNMDRIIIAATGLGYLIVGIEQLRKQSISNAFIWFGYSFAQIGLWMSLK
jgi:hypothetical protein